MNFELDRDGRTAEGERYYVYVSAGRKKRCIGQAVRSERSGLWLAYANGKLLASAPTSEDAARRLWSYEAIRRPGLGGSARKPFWECTLEERFARLRKKVPRRHYFTDQVVQSARRIPLERRAPLLEDVDELIEDLESQLLWWRKVRKELGAAPKLIRFK